MTSHEYDIGQLNALFADCDSNEIVRWVQSNAQSPAVSTSFGPNSAVLLHLVTRIMPDIPVIWVDSGYNTNATYQFALELIDLLNLNMKIYTPDATSAFLTVKMKGIPDVETQAHKDFTETIKLDPFRRALNEINPDMWITGVRAHETAYRRSLDPVTVLEMNRLKIAPILNWREQDVLSYITSHDLPIENNYFDPTKSFEGRECGLHTRL